MRQDSLKSQSALWVRPEPETLTCVSLARPGGTFTVAFPAGEASKPVACRPSCLLWGHDRECHQEHVLPSAITRKL